MKIQAILLSAAMCAANITSAGATTVRHAWVALDQPLTAPMMPSYTKKRHKHVYYGIGGSKHQTATGGPAGGITSRQ